MEAGAEENHPQKNAATNAFTEGLEFDVAVAWCTISFRLYNHDETTTPPPNNSGMLAARAQDLQPIPKAKPDEPGVVL